MSDDGALVSAYDPKANETARRHLPESVTLADNPVAATDGTQAVILMTEWDQIINADWGTVARQMRQPRFVFDGRNALEQSAMERLGFEYRGVGRSGTVDCNVKTIGLGVKAAAREH